MQQPTRKTHTANGKKIAPFTMRVSFKPEFQRANPQGGEMYQTWTYRCDTEAEKLRLRSGIEFKLALDVLGYIYIRDFQKYQEVKIFDNLKQGPDQLLYHEIKGKIVVPVEPDRQTKFRTWIKTLL